MATIAKNTDKFLPPIKPMLFYLWAHSLCWVGTVYCFIAVLRYQDLSTSAFRQSTFELLVETLYRGLSDWSGKPHAFTFCVCLTAFVFGASVYLTLTGWRFSKGLVHNKLEGTFQSTATWHGWFRRWITRLLLSINIIVIIAPFAIWLIIWYCPQVEFHLLRYFFGPLHSDVELSYLKELYWQARWETGVFGHFAISNLMGHFALAFTYLYFTRKKLPLHGDR